MFKIFDTLQAAIDRSVETKVRRHASVHGRRSFLSRVGQAMVGAAVVPMLPFDRFGEAHAASMSDRQDTDPDVLRLLALLRAIGPAPCECCGGSPTTCPPAPRSRRCRGSALARTRRTRGITSSATTTAAAKSPAISAAAPITSATSRVIAWA